MLHIQCMYTSLLCSAHMRSSAVFFSSFISIQFFLDHKKAVFTFNFLCASTAYFYPMLYIGNFFYYMSSHFCTHNFLCLYPSWQQQKKFFFFTSLFTIGKKMFGMGIKKKIFFEVVWMMLNASFFLFVYAMGIFIPFFLHFKWKYMFECEYEIGLCCYCSWIKTQKKIQRTRKRGKVKKQ